jgi:recombinational DNA repair protein (RecF pathway)
MAYATYITDALVCGTKESNTSDKSYLLFAREAGMLFASARSVREERSKQRFALQEFSHVRVTLIKGKSGWRIGSVESFKNYYQQALTKDARGSVVRIFRNLRRFIHGEESAPILFDSVITSLESACCSVPNRGQLDAFIELKLLESLGYVSQKDIPPSLKNTDIKTISAIKDAHLEKQVEKILEHARSVSHL